MLETIADIESDSLFAEWAQYQTTHSNSVSYMDEIDISSLRYVGGLDISFDKTDPNLACAYLTVLDYSTLEIVAEYSRVCQMSVPYKSGFLGFREVPHYIALLEEAKLKSNANSCDNADTEGQPFPQVLLVDGFGVLHHRRFGSASHLGVVYNIPTIGVAKTLISHEGLQERVVRDEFDRLCYRKGDRVPLMSESGFVWGNALKSSEASKKPIYVSIGHKVSLDTATEIVLNVCRTRIPEPIRVSDIQSKCVLKRI
jgi:deoxyinosine 3'endonuclease (endonuclease V)